MKTSVKHFGLAFGS